MFGKGSLFQMLNMTVTYSGRHRLAEILLNPLEKKDDIKGRQDALQELGKKLVFRHKLVSNVLLSNKDVVLTEEDGSSKKEVRRLLTP